MIYSNRQLIGFIEFDMLPAGYTGFMNRMGISNARYFFSTRIIVDT